MQLFSHSASTPTSPPGLSKTSHDGLSMRIWGLAGSRACQQTNRKKKRSSEASLCFVWIWQLESLLREVIRRFVKRSYQKKEHLAVTSTQLASSFPTEHASVSWLIFIHSSFDLSDVLETCKLKILSFWGGEEFNTDHCFLCNICLTRRNILSKTSTALLPTPFSQRTSEIWWTPSYLKNLTQNFFKCHFISHFIGKTTFNASGVFF